MQHVFPPSTNADYSGSGYSAWFLALLGLAWIGPGLVHSLLADGGAGVIAGIDLTHGRRTIVALFAWAGATQIAHGLVMVAIGLWYRPLVPMLLVISLIERVLLAWSGWVRHAPPTGHHPPEHYGSLVAIPLICVFLALSLRPQRN
ncbi:MAG: hypothetical protein K2P79_08290 [Sphingomonas sp.]|nr:hypothetical protein [Sphingomonas sp.]